MQGNSVDVEGNSVDVKSSSAGVKGNSAVVKGKSVDVEGNSVDVKGKSVDVKARTATPRIGLPAELSLFWAEQSGSPIGAMCVPPSLRDRPKTTKVVGHLFK
eukprot:2373186-Pyramimonas_sp.AAC.3